MFASYLYRLVTLGGDAEQSFELTEAGQTITLSSWD